MILDKIVARKRQEVQRLKSTGIRRPGIFEKSDIAPPRGFKRALVDYPGVAIIAEVKKASPSKGILSHDFDPVAIGCNYERQGAQAVSVLTDVDFFQGSLLYLMQVREHIGLPVLRKDFIIDPIQITEAAHHGADAILLIAAILDEQQIADYRLIAQEAGMDSLVEIHDEHDLEKALAAGSDLIGINNRNLNDFSVDIVTTFRLKKQIPDSIPVISESGLSSATDIALLEQNNICAALIGESLMRAGHDSGLLHSLRA
jgi:indole-3-glycerol phosphate synthase